MEEKKKIGFFKRLYISIVKLEDYPIFFDEPLYKSILYFIAVCILGSLLLGIGCSLFMNKIFFRGFSYLKTSVPNFTIENGMIKEELLEYGYDKKYDLYFRIDSKEDMNYSDAVSVAAEEYGDLFTDANNFVLLYKTKAFIKYKEQHIELGYKEFLERMQMDSLDKETLVSELDENEGPMLYLVPILIILVFGFSNILIELENVLILTLFAILTAMIIARLRISLKTAFELVCHTETVPIIVSNLFLIYYLQPQVNSFVSDKLLGLISYIYIAAVLLIIKADLIEAYQVAVGMKDEDESDTDIKLVPLEEKDKLNDKEYEKVKNEKEEEIKSNEDNESEENIKEKNEEVQENINIDNNEDNKNENEVNEEDNNKNEDDKNDEDKDKDKEEIKKD